MPNLNFDVQKLWDLVWESIQSDYIIVGSLDVLAQKRTEDKLEVKYKASFYMSNEVDYSDPSNHHTGAGWSTVLDYEEKICVFDIVNKDGVDELIYDEWLDSGREYSISVDDPTTDKAVIEEWRELISTIIDKEDAINYLEEVGKQGSPALYSLCKKISRNGMAIVDDE